MRADTTIYFLERATAEREESAGVFDIYRQKCNAPVKRQAPEGAYYSTFLRHIDEHVNKKEKAKDE